MEIVIVIFFGKYGSGAAGRKLKPPGHSSAVFGRDATAQRTLAWAGYQIWHIGRGEPAARRSVHLNRFRIAIAEIISELCPETIVHA